MSNLAEAYFPSVAKTRLPNNVLVSTIKLLNQRDDGEDTWETMVLYAPGLDFQDRYGSEEEARNGHKRVVEALLAGKDPNEEQP